MWSGWSIGQDGHWSFGQLGHGAAIGQMVIGHWSFGHGHLVRALGAMVSNDCGQDDGHGRDEEQRERD